MLFESPPRFAKGLMFDRVVIEAEATRTSHSLVNPNRSGTRHKYVHDELRNKIAKLLSVYPRITGMRMT